MVVNRLVDGLNLSDASRTERRWVWDCDLVAGGRWLILSFILWLLVCGRWLMVLVNGRWAEAFSTLNLYSAERLYKPEPTISS